MRRKAHVDGSVERGGDEGNEAFGVVFGQQELAHGACVHVEQEVCGRTHGGRAAVERIVLPGVERSAAVHETHLAGTDELETVFAKGFDDDGKGRIGFDDVHGPSSRGFLRSVAQPEALFFEEPHELVYLRRGDVQVALDAAQAETPLGVRIHRAAGCKRTVEEREHVPSVRRERIGRMDESELLAVRDVLARLHVVEHIGDARQDVGPMRAADLEARVPCAEVVGKFEREVDSAPLVSVRAGAHAQGGCRAVEIVGDARRRLDEAGGVVAFV